MFGAWYAKLLNNFPNVILILGFKPRISIVHTMGVKWNKEKAGRKLWGQVERSQGKAIRAGELSNMSAKKPLQFPI